MKHISKLKVFALLVCLLIIDPTMAAGFSSKGIANITKKDMDILVKTVVGEARGEGFNGMRAVAEVILNRVNHKKFPNTVHEVCLQPKQFSCWNADDRNRSKINSLNGQSRFYKMAKLAVDRALSDHRLLPESVTHFHTKAVSPTWAKKRTPVASIKQHVFYSA